ncbi:MAG: TRAP transporter substrate-binding protein [Clostridiales bacterium]
MKKAGIGICLMLAIIFVLGACGGSAAREGQGSNVAPQEKVHITVGHAGSEATLMHRAWEVFKKEVEEVSGGKMTVEIYANGQLGGDQQLQEAVQNGDLIATACNTAALTGFEPKLGVFATPFLFADNQAAYELLDGEFGDKMLNLMEESGFKGLGFYESVHFRVLSANKPVHTPDDLKGVKIRVMQNPIHIAIWEALGAGPTSIPFSELYTALQQKTVDAQENPLELIVAQRFYEVQQAVTLTNHLFSVGMATMNLDFYNSLSAEQQKIVEDAVEKAVAFQREAGAAEYKDYLKTLQDAGIEVVMLTPQELELFREKAKAAYPVIAKEVGQDLLDELLAATK